MQEYDIKKGHFKEIEGNKLEKLMKETFGSVKSEGGFLVSSYGALAPIKVRIKSKKSMEIETVMKTDVDNTTASDTIKLYNDFLLAATGFTSKERKRRLNQKAKKGTL